MDEDEIRIVWQGGMLYGKQTVYARIDTTIPNVLEALKSLGKTPEYFNSLIVGTGVGKKLKTTLFVKGSKFGQIRNALWEKGLGKPVWKS